MRRVGDAPCVFSCQVLKRPLRKSNEEKTTPVGCLFLLFFFFSFEKIRRPLLSLKNWSFRVYFWFFLFFKKFFRETFLIGKLDEKELRKKKFNIIGIVYIVSLIRTSYIIQVKKSTRVEIGDMQLKRLSIVNYVMDWRRQDVLQTRYLRSLQFSVSGCTLSPTHMQIVHDYRQYATRTTVQKQLLRNNEQNMSNYSTIINRYSN